MAPSPVFDSLVSTLSTAERRQMLERIRSSIVIDEEPVERQLDLAETDIDYAFDTMGLWRRLLVFLRMVLGALSREEAVEQYLMRGLARRLRSEAAHLVDVSEGAFLPDFKGELERLAAAARFFDAAVGRVRNAGLGPFYSFALGLEMPDTRDDLLVDTDPFILADRMPDADEYEVRREAEARLSDLLGGVPAWVRNTMGANARFFESLAALVDFDFGELTGCFETAPGREEEERCECDHVRAPLQQLGRILKGLAPAPSPSFLETLVLFEGDLGRADQDLESVLGDRVAAVQARLDVIRGFARRIPFFDILRFTVGDLSYRLPDPTGGQGWMGQVERFFQGRLDTMFQLYSFERKKDDLLAQAQELTGEEGLSPLGAYPVRSGRRNGTHATSLAMLAAFLRGAQESSRAATLKTLFVQGAFYKEENRGEFNEYYAELGDLLNAVDAFAGRLADGGDLRAALAEARRDGGDLAAAADRVDEAADRLTRRGVECLHGLAEILRGVLYGEVGGRYDTLSNLDEVAGRENRSFKSELDEVLTYLKSASSLLGSMYDVEKTSARRHAALRKRQP